MIAIAGAKGGCGKTVTTLGLTEGFARTGTPAIAIDADRQLPNLHVAGGVDREPTLAALTSDRSVQSIAQTSPRTSNAGIVAAPKSSDQLDLESVFETITTDSTQPIVDCPSGAGPDVVEPLSAADGVIVVTTDSDRSLTAAETTVEMARRLNVPVLGTVVNRCEEVPPEVESWVDVPVLGIVPETESPLSDEAAVSAYETIVETLQTRNVTNLTPPEYDDELLPTGIETLDRRLGGGLAPGTVVALTAEPASQSEQFLYAATAPRGTLYLSTERTTANVSRAIESTDVATGNPTIRHVSGSGAIENATELIQKLPDSATLVVDLVDTLERCDRATYVSFLNELKERMIDTGSVAILHCLNDAEHPPNRSATVHAVDAVFDLHTVAPGLGTDVEHYLSIPKFRHESAFSETIELDFEGSAPVPIRTEANAD